MELQPDLRLLLRAADTSKTTIILGTPRSGKSRIAAAIAAMNGQATYDGGMHPDSFRWLMYDAKMVLPAELTTEREPDDLLVYDTPYTHRNLRKIYRPTDARRILCFQARRAEKNKPPDPHDAAQNPPPISGASLVLGMHINNNGQHIVKVHNTKLPMLEGKEIDITSFLKATNDWRRAVTEGAHGDRTPN